MSATISQEAKVHLKNYFEWILVGRERWGWAIIIMNLICVPQRLPTRFPENIMRFTVHSSNFYKLNRNNLRT